MVSTGSHTLSMPRPYVQAPPLGHRAEPPLTVGGLLALGLWCSFFLLSPIYVMPSGYPQLADAAIVLLFPLLLLPAGLRIPKSAFPVVNAMSLFVLYAVTVDLVWTAILSDLELVRRASYFVFNFCACLVFLTLYGRYGRRALQWTVAAVCASMAIQVAVLLAPSGATNSGQGRVTGLFNNPNQLGYFAVLYGSLFWVWSELRNSPRGSKVWWPLCVYGAMLFLAVQSLSRAAVAAALLLMLLAGLRNRRVLLVGLLGGCLLGLAGIQLQKVQDLEARVEQRSRGVTDELMSRGYDRLLNHPEYLILGAGEGAQYRINSRNPDELHSSLGTMLFCYGGVGLALLLYIFYVTAKGCGVSSLLYFVPVTFYGLTHMGLRQSELWIMLMLVVCLRWRARPAAGRSEERVVEAYAPTARPVSLGRQPLSEVLQ